MMIELLEWAAVVVDGVGVLVMLLGFVLAIVRFAPIALRNGDSAIGEMRKIRCGLGTYLVFALELMIISDLLHSLVSRTLEDLYFLAGIVVLRTLIAYFLNKEIQELHEQSA